MCRDIGEHLPALYYNNMGCVHHYIAKPNLSTFYLQKALVEEEEAMKALVIENGLDHSSFRVYFLSVPVFIVITKTTNVIFVSRQCNGTTIVYPGVKS